MIDYAQFPGLVCVYLEDSYVLAVVDTPGQFTFTLDAVLTPESPAHHSPSPGEPYCFAAGNPVFSGVTDVEWMKRVHGHYTDADGEVDLGNIDILVIDGDAIVVEGDWGRVRIRATAGPRAHLLRVQRDD